MSEPSQRGSKVVGTVNQIVPVYVQDLSVTSLPGLANVFASTVSASWFRSDATGASSFAIISTAALGTYSSGNWTQVNSTIARGWYELGIPSAAFSSGQWAVVHVYAATTSTTTFSHSPIFFELTKTDNQTYVSSQTLSTAICRIYSSPIITTYPGIQTADVSTFIGSPLVTTAAGILSVGRVGVSSFGLDVGVSSMNTGLSVNVTTFNSRVGVSSFNSPVGVSSFDVGLQVGVSSFGVPVGVSSFNVGLQVGVSSFNSRVGVSSFGIAVGVSSVQDKGGYGVSTVSDKSDYGVSSVTGLNTALIDASISSRLASAGYTAPDNTGIAAIQTQTDKLTYTVLNEVDVNIKSVNDVTVIGTGTSSDTWGPL